MVVTQRVQREMIFMVIGSSIGLHVEAFCRQFNVPVTTARKCKHDAAAGGKLPKLQADVSCLASAFFVCSLRAVGSCWLTCAAA